MAPTAAAAAAAAHASVFSAFDHVANHKCYNKDKYDQNHCCRAIHLYHPSSIIIIMFMFIG